MPSLILITREEVEKPLEVINPNKAESFYNTPSKVLN